MTNKEFVKYIYPMANAHYLEYCKKYVIIDDAATTIWNWLSYIYVYESSAWRNAANEIKKEMLERLEA